MACSFQGSKCEGSGQACEGAAHTVYEVKVTEGQQLCGPCAAEKSHLIVTEKVGQPTRVCEKHKKDVEYFCETHDQEACISCATVSHQKPSCELRDLEDVVADMKAEAAEVLVTATERKEVFTRMQEILDLEKAAFEKSSESEANKIKVKWCKGNKQIQEKEDELAIKINQKADEAIKKINDERNDQLRKLTAVADDERKSIKQMQDRELLTLTLYNKYVLNELQRYGSDLQQMSWSLQENMAKVTMSLKKDNTETIMSIKQVVRATKESVENEPAQTTLISLNACCIKYHNPNYDGFFGSPACVHCRNSVIKRTAASALKKDIETALGRL